MKSERAIASYYYYDICFRFTWGLSFDVGTKTAVGT